ncbi:RING/U-box superfamily protein, partial [Melia azedarach]
EEPAVCLFDMWQQESALPPSDCPGTFFVQLRINFIVEYIPQAYHMNVRRQKRQGFLERSDLVDDIKVRSNMTRMMKLLPVSEVDLDRIIKIVGTRAKLMDSDACNADRDVIPVVMSLRVYHTQQYSEEVDIAWGSRLGRSLQNCVPALETAVEDLDKVVYDVGGGCCLRDQCPICLVGFEKGEEITRLPCLHDFHEDCIQKWLKKSHLCPFCRFPLPVCGNTETFCPFKEIKPPAFVSLKPRMRIGRRPWPSVDVRS